MIANIISTANSPSRAEWTGGKTVNARRTAIVGPSSARWI